MSNTEDIVSQVDQQSPGLLDAVAEEDDLSKEELVRKILSISHGHMVRTHQNPGGAILCGDDDGICWDGGARSEEM